MALSEVERLFVVGADLFVRSSVFNQFLQNGVVVSSESAHDSFDSTLSFAAC